MQLSGFTYALVFTCDEAEELSMKGVVDVVVGMIY